MPKRIQRKRTKGWKMPANAVYVGRPTKWGNPFKLYHHYMRGDFQGVSGLLRFIFTEAYDGHQDERFTTIKTQQQAVEWFRWYMTELDKDFSELRGKDLACWCPLDSPCHADVLLELANREPQQ